MEKYLLDTHVLLWWLSDPAKLANESREAIACGRNTVSFSSAGAWEMAIKKTLGRLEYPRSLETVLRNNHIEILPVTLAHALAVADLPLHHQDPFDRMIIAQARIEEMTVITRDSAFDEYDVKTLPA